MEMQNKKKVAGNGREQPKPGKPRETDPAQPESRYTDPSGGIAESVFQREADISIRGVDPPRDKPKPS
jgi:hypothetical protein